MRDGVDMNANDLHKIYKELSTQRDNENTIYTEGVKHDTDKPPMELLSHHALVEIAKVFGFGAKKYGRYNYRSGIWFSRIIGAAYRHLGAFNAGEDADPESDLSHIAHLGCCVVMLLDYIRENPDLDDRYKPKNPPANPSSSETSDR